MKKLLSIICVSMSIVSLFGQFAPNSVYYNAWGSNRNNVNLFNALAWNKTDASGALSGTLVPDGQDVYMVGSAAATGGQGYIAYYTDATNNNMYNANTSYGTSANEVRFNGNGTRVANDVLTANIKSLNVNLNGSDTVTTQRELMIQAQSNTNQPNASTGVYTFSVAEKVNIVSGMLSFKKNTTNEYKNLNQAVHTTFQYFTYNIVSNGGAFLRGSDSALVLGSKRWNTAVTTNYADYVSNVTLGTVNVGGEYTADDYALKVSSTGVVELAYSGVATFNNRVDMAAGSTLKFSIIGTDLIFKDSVNVAGTASFENMLNNGNNADWLTTISFAGDKGGAIFDVVDFSVLSSEKTKLVFTGLDDLLADTEVMSWNTLTGITASELESKANGGLSEDINGSFVLRGDTLVYVIPEPSEVAGLLGLIALGFVLRRKIKR